MCVASATRKALFRRRPSRASYQLTNRLTPIVAAMTAQLSGPISGSAGFAVRPRAPEKTSQARARRAKPIRSVAAVSNLRWPYGCARSGGAKAKAATMRPMTLFEPSTRLW